MNQMIQIRSVKQYFNEFIYENRDDLQQALRRAQIKMQLLDAFRKEIFGQITMKLGQDATNISREELANLDFVSNILTNGFRKWRRLCILCSEAGLGNWLSLEDLRQILEEDEAPDGHTGASIAEEEKDENASKAV